jgi:hypothetical protein
MKGSTYKIEKLFSIWESLGLEHYEVGPDVDNLGLLEIRYYNDESTPITAISFTKEMLPLLIQALDSLREDN